MFTEKLHGPPGTGKTYALIERVRGEIDSGMAPEDIGYYSFTRAAAREASRRISIDGQFPHFRTIHSECFKLLGLARDDVIAGAKLHSFAQAFGYEISDLSEDQDIAEHEVREKVLRTLGDYLLFFEEWRKNLLLDTEQAYRSFMRMEDLPLGWSLPVVVKFQERYEAYKRDNGLYDFADMLLEVLKEGLSPRVKALILDECLPYHMPVLLANGDSLPIGRIVEEQLPVEVMSYNLKTGQQEAKRVIGYRKLVLQKPLVKVSAHWRKKRSEGKALKRSFVVCTNDHEILTDAGYKPAGNIQPGELIQIEANASCTQRYKTATKGRQSLSALMREKNQRLNFRTDNRTGHITKRGGNGQPLPIPQQLLLGALGPGWVAEHSISLGYKKAGYPTHYKVDIANLDYQIAIEVDGETHRGKRRALDAKKDSALEALGWKVYRLKNQEVMQHLQQIVAQFIREKKDCPKWVKVVSVQPVQIKDYFVYDISVEGNHNFYANGILVHNCQDLSPLQFKVIDLWLGGVERHYIAGDPFQAIYQWQGARPELFEARQADKRTLLDQSFRLPRKVYELSRQIIAGTPAYRPRDAEGYIKRVLAQRALEAVEQIDGSAFILVRNRYLLTALVEELYLRGVPFGNLRGPSPFRGEIASRVLLLRRFLRNEPLAIANLTQLLEHIPQKPYLARGLKAEIKRRAQETPGALVRLPSLLGQVTEVFTRLAGSDEYMDLLKMPPQYRSYFGRVIAKHGEAALTGRPKILLGTIHSVKGEEADHVIILPDMAKRTWLGWTADPAAEARVWYVAVTRAKQGVTLVDAQQMRCFKWPKDNR